ncbi:DUF1631 family protein [Spectribacter hydrogenooxidans]|uniref:DUF1631 family protein n=1 Tax=Spectribacter hydrogenoxidans TaxID=3075608 RepID=A0ABU3BZK0_9GAMM|nr:DUF1631 family protein [Salinisphaera sp. W335]MDT0634742.1 DUF1631 family protein [Salinisphaera sp. W335]
MTHDPTPDAAHRTTGRAAAAAFRDAALDEFSGLVDNLFVHAEETVFDLADARGSPAPPAARLRALRRAQATVTRAFIEEITDRLRYGPPPDIPNLPAAPAFESLIAVSGMATRAEAAHREAVQALEARLAWLAARQTGVAEHGASPLALCQAFAQAVDTAGLDEPAQALLDDLFEHTLQACLATCYERLLAVLERHQVPATPRRTGHDEHRSTLTAPTNSRRARRDQTRNAVSPEQHFGAGEVMAVLEAMTSSPVEPDIPIVDYLLARLRRDQTDAAPRGLQPDLRQHLRLADAIWRDALDDSPIDAAIRPFIARLRPLLLQTALLDPAGIRVGDHAARRLLQTIADPIGGTDHWRDPLERLIDSFADDPDRLEPLVDEVAAAVTAHQPTDWRERLPPAHRLIRLEFRQQTLDRVPPAPAQRFLLGAWGPRMAVAWLQEGLGGPAWRRAAAQLDQLLDLLQPADSPERADHRRPDQQQLLSDLHGALRRIRFSPARLINLLDGLEQAFEQANQAPPAPAGRPMNSWEPHNTVFDDSGAHAGADQHFERIVATAMAAPDAKPVAASPPEALFDAVERLCRHGTWFRFETGPSGAGRWMKFAALDRVTQLAHFTNRRGDFVQSYPLADLAADLKTGRARAIADAGNMEARITELLGLQPSAPAARNESEGP